MFSILVALLAAYSPLLLALVVTAAARRIRWLLAPNYAPLVIHSEHRTPRHNILKLRSPDIAYHWITDPPNVLLVGLGGLLAFARSGDPLATSLLFETVLPSRHPTYAVIEEACQDRDDVRRLILDVQEVCHA